MTFFIHDGIHHRHLSLIAFISLPALFGALSGSVIAPSAMIIGGSGNFTFMYMPDRVVLPPGACTSDACNCHGLGVDSNKNILLTYEPDRSNSSSDQHCMIRFHPDGTDGVVFGPTEELCAGTPHGLTIATEKSGEQFLYHANNGESLHKTRLDGTVLWSTLGPPSSSMEPYRPTWFAAPPGSDFVYLADGYGSNLIHVYSAAAGEYTGRTYGGEGTAEGTFETCHAISHDPRSGKGGHRRHHHLVVTDRENHRHQYFQYDPKSPDVFQFKSEFSIPELPRPCHFRPAAPGGGDYAVIPSLEGPVGIVDAQNKLVSLINVGELLGDKGHLHPHDAILLPSGDLVVATWNPGRISYWKRIPPTVVNTKDDSNGPSSQQRMGNNKLKEVAV